MARTAKLIGFGLAFMGAAALSACIESAPPTEAPPPVEAELTGPWTLNPEASALTYLSIKSNNIAEVNTFGELSGSVSEDGAASISINLNSVNTNVDIRNERMRNVFFETETYPAATVTTDIDMAQFTDIDIGDSVAVPLRFDISLHGATRAYDFDAEVTRLGANKVLVDSDAPLILYPEDFDLIDGLAQLQALAGIDAITPIVPVNVSFVFERKG
ncbi:MAG: YceI family protein [Pseudomonadota bacterium]